MDTSADISGSALPGEQYLGVITLIFTLFLFFVYFEMLPTVPLSHYLYRRYYGYSYSMGQSYKDIIKAIQLLNKTHSNQSPTINNLIENYLRSSYRQDPNHVKEFVNWCVENNFCQAIINIGYIFEDFIDILISKQYWDECESNLFYKTIMQLPNRECDMHELLAVIENSYSCYDKYAETIMMLVNRNPTLLDSDLPTKALLNKLHGVNNFTHFVNKNRELADLFFSKKILSNLVLTSSNISNISSYLQYIIDRGFDPSKKIGEDGKRLIHSVAGTSFQFNSMKILIEWYSSNKMNIDVEDSNGFTPFCYFIIRQPKISRSWDKCDATECIYLFLNAGADPDHITNTHGSIFTILKNTYETETHVDEQNIKHIQRIISEWKEWKTKKSTQNDRLSNIDF